MTLALHRSQTATAFCRLVLAALCASLFAVVATPARAQDDDVPAEAPNLPASLRSLVPPGWVATSFAEVDMNKDGNMDRAVLLAPNVAGEGVVGPIAGTPLRDRCRNLILMVGQPNGRPPVVNYLPWSQLPADDVTMAKDTCLDQAPPEPDDGTANTGFSDSLKAVRNTLHYPWEAMDWPGEFEGTLVIRIEGTCLRLIGEERTESNHGAAWRSSAKSSTNYLTRETISSSTYDTRCDENDADCKEQYDSMGPVTSKIDQREPICLNDRPLLIEAETLPQTAVATPNRQLSTAVPTAAATSPSAAQPSPPVPVPAPPSAPMTVEELWRHPPVGSRFSWARWSDGKEESYLRLPDGKLYTRPGITIWTAKGPLRLVRTDHHHEAADLTGCPDDPYADGVDDDLFVRCVGELSWQTWSALDADGHTVWTTAGDLKIWVAADLDELELSFSDSRGVQLRMANYLTYVLWWVDSVSGQRIVRPSPTAVQSAVRREYRSESEAMGGDPSDPSDPSDPRNRHLEDTDLFAVPIPTCGVIRDWEWGTPANFEDSPFFLSVQNRIAPTDIEPNPVVDCTYRPGFDGPEAVGWSAIVR